MEITEIYSHHTVLAIKKKFRQIKAISAFLPQQLPCKNQSFWEKVIVPTGSYNGVENEKWPKFDEFSYEIVPSRRNAQVWVSEVKM